MPPRAFKNPHTLDHVTENTLPTPPTQTEPNSKKRKQGKDSTGTGANKRVPGGGSTVEGTPNSTPLLDKHPQHPKNTDNHSTVVHDDQVGGQWRNRNMKISIPSDVNHNAVTHMDQPPAHPSVAPIPTESTRLDSPFGYFDYRSLTSPSVAASPLRTFSVPKNFPDSVPRLNELQRRLGAEDHSLHGSTPPPSGHPLESSQGSPETARHSPLYQHFAVGTRALPVPTVEVGPFALPHEESHGIFTHTHGACCGCLPTNDVIGGGNWRKVLQDCIEKPIKCAQHYSAPGICEVTRTIAMYGSKGAGKETLLYSFCNQINMPILRLCGPHLSDSTVSNIYAEARNRAPCVVLWKDYDSYLTKNDKGTVGHDICLKIVTELQKVVKLGSMVWSVFLLCNGNKTSYQRELTCNIQSHQFISPLQPIELLQVLKSEFKKRIPPVMQGFLADKRINDIVEKNPHLVPADVRAFVSKVLCNIMAKIPIEMLEKLPRHHEMLCPTAERIAEVCTSTGMMVEYDARKTNVDRFNPSRVSVASKQG